MLGKLAASRRDGEPMIQTMRSNYAAPLLRAFKQAPWRSQTQAVAMLSIALLTAAVVGGFYLAVAARAATAGRDLQSLEAQKTDLLQSNDELQAELANLRSINRLAARADALGLKPATSDQLQYMRVQSFPQDVQLKPPPRAVLPPPPPSYWQIAATWLKQTGALLSTLAARWMAHPKG
jgi:hypothetical protein